MTSTQKWTGSYVSGATVAALVILRGGWWCATIKKGGEVYRDSIKGGSPLEIASKVAILARGPPSGGHSYCPLH